MASQTQHLIVLGGAGEGKSTMIKNGFLGRDENGQEPECAKNPMGVTKNATPYYGKVNGKDGEDIVVTDFPGVGDMTVNTSGFIAQFETLLQAAGSTQVNGVIVTVRVDACRLSTAQQIVMKLIELGKITWEHVVFVGTWSDKAEDEDLSVFENDMVPKFYSEISGQQDIVGKWATVSRADYSKLWPQIAALPRCAISYTLPDSGEMDRVIGPLANEKPGQLKEEIDLNRALVAKATELSWLGQIFPSAGRILGENYQKAAASKTAQELLYAEARKEVIQAAAADIGKETMIETTKNIGKEAVAKEGSKVVAKKGMAEMATAAVGTGLKSVGGIGSYVASGSQIAVEACGYTKTGKTIGAVGQVANGAFNGALLAGPPGALAGGTAGLAFWATGELIGFLVQAGIECKKVQEAAEFGVKVLDSVAKAVKT